MRRLRRITFATAISLIALGAASGRAAASDEGLEIFEKWIRPTLIEKCIECHGPDEQEAGLQLDSRTGWSEGGDSGPAIVPGDPAASLLVKAVRYTDSALEMPPDGRLPDKTIAAFEQWVRLGAPDPRDGALASRSGGVSLEQGRDFWSFQPIRAPRVPDVVDETWPATEIDRFVLARLEENGLNPSPDEQQDALVRRVYFDLTGLPPTPAQLERHLADPSPKAYRALVDQLLDTKEFGERWGRRWLDVVRFAESSGGGRTLLFPDAWRYRDYVIDSFNADQPYDDFVAEQIAGDLMESSSSGERSRRLIATAFLLLGPTNYELQDKDILEMDIVDEQLDTLGKSLLGMTIGCARCHDHKFDPIPTHDYYAMAGILKSTKSVIHENVSTWNKRALPLAPEQERVRVARDKSIARIEKDLAKEKKQLKTLASRNGSGATDLVKQPQPQAQLQRRVKSLESKLKQLQQAQAARPIAMATTDGETPQDIHVAIRGVVHNQGPLVKRGVLRAATASSFPEISAGTSGRLELAQWIADGDNPLTARVMANRVWDWLLGRGIVRTVNNFGSMGEAPSHPELLDHLAKTFVADGWSVKRLVRRVMLSRVYRMSADSSPAGESVDPQNRLLWRMNNRRLEAEEIRDALLFISGELDTRPGGPVMKKGTTTEYGYVFETRRRSVYVPVFRNNLPEIFEVFDFADPNTPGGSRNASTIAPQALLLMNHPFVIERSRAAAERLLIDTEVDSSQRVAQAYRRVLGRPPTDSENAAAYEFVERTGERSERWAMLFQTLFQSLDFRYLN